MAAFSENNDQEYETFLTILNREDQLRARFSQGDYTDMDPYENLVKLDASQFPEMRKAMNKRMRQNRKTHIRRQDTHYIPNTWSGKCRKEDALHPFYALFDTLPPYVVLAGGAVLDQVRGHTPKDFDLFLLHDPERKPEDQVMEILSHFSNISYISRSGNAITFLFYLPHAESCPYHNQPEPSASDRQKRVGDECREAIRIALLSDNEPCHQRSEVKQILREWKMKEKTARRNIRFSDCECKNHKINVQIILRLYHAPTEIVHGFDLDASGLLYHKGHFYATQRAQHVIKTMTQYVTLSRASTTYNRRLTKYCLKKAFRIRSPVLITKEHRAEVYNMRISHHTPVELEGSLLGLLRMRHMGVSRKSNPTWGSSDYVEYDFPESGAYTYPVFRIVRDWDRKVIYYGFRPKFVELKNIIDLDVSKITNLDEEADGFAIPTTIEFITTEPGRQWTGSFHPMDINISDWGRTYMDGLDREIIRIEREALAKKALKYKMRKAYDESLKSTKGE